MTLIVRGSEIASNHGSYGGGGIRLRSGSTLMMEDSVVSGNDAIFDGYGGGLMISGATATIARSTISDNFSDYQGGGLLIGNSHVNIIDSTIANNVAGGYEGHGGGGVYGHDSTLIARNTTITGNSAPNYGGGGIDVARSQLDLANSIVAGNTVTPGCLVGSDIFGAITLTDGHNIFGSDVGANPAGDRRTSPPAPSSPRSIPTPAVASSTPAASSRSGTTPPTRR